MNEVKHCLPKGRMVQIQIWIGVNRDGDEGLLFGPGETPGTTNGEVIIMSVNNPEEAELLKPLAQKTADEYAKEGTFLKIKLATFIRTT